MAFADTWHIRSRARQCASTERPFEEGETIITALFPDPESSGYLRKDFCLEAWDARTEDDEKPFSSWRTKYAPPVVDEKVDPMKKEDPLTLLRRLVDEDEEHTENVRYILAVMLERKKKLRETDSQPTPDGILRVYEHRKEGDIFIVRDPNIPLDRIDEVQQEIFLLLEQSGQTPPAESDSEETVGADETADVEGTSDAEETTVEGTTYEPTEPSNSEESEATSADSEASEAAPTESSEEAPQNETAEETQEDPQ